MTQTLNASGAAISTSARSLAPDLARGFMLLAIALAHAPALVGDWSLGPAALNTAVGFLKSLLADNQARAMFVFLFGYGLGQLAYRQQARGEEWISVRKLLRRRGFWLLVIGSLNAVVLVPIDIIAVYGLTLLMAAPLVRARDAVLGWTAGLTLIPATLLLAWQSVRANTLAAAGTPETLASYMEPDFLTHLVAGLPSWPVETLIACLIVLPGMLMGIWAARRRILDEPERHVSLLRRVTWGFLLLAVAGRLPAALLVSGVWATESVPVQWLVAVAHDLTGYLGGVGMAAAVGLAAVAIGERRGPFTTALVALGQRSMTFYIFQSVVWLALFYPFTLGLHDAMGAAATWAVAAGVWVVSLLLAEWMRRAGWRGPGEVLLRKLSYKKTG
ncbi:DUF418 domain-containing protein [Nonomuraea typhae]|uniref:DUF418 domain-containing protein n=1 Tax=Nonomuraea typhae TaxID=2603600 RepID=UPI0012F7F0A1|nr:DUF418 domain-containing protein [Nonomuraea typhae]